MYNLPYHKEPNEAAIKEFIERYPNKHGVSTWHLKSIKRRKAGFVVRAS